MSDPYDAGPSIDSKVQIYFKDGVKPGEFLDFEYDEGQLNIETRSLAGNLTKACLDAFRAVAKPYITVEPKTDEERGFDFRVYEKNQAPLIDAIMANYDFKSAINNVQEFERSKLTEMIKSVTIRSKPDQDISSYLVVQVGEDVYDTPDKIAAALGVDTDGDNRRKKPVNKWLKYGLVTAAALAALFYSGENCICGPGQKPEDNVPVKECPAPEEISDKIICGCDPGEEQRVTYDPDKDIYICICDEPVPDVEPGTTVQPGDTAEPVVPDPVPKPQCSDGIDNDGDRKIDYPADPGCRSAEDDNEYNASPSIPQCRDGKDNDRDGLTDYPADPGCSSGNDDNEYNRPLPPPSDDKRSYEGREWPGLDSGPEPEPRHPLREPKRHPFTDVDAD
ncbi:hypothetical protein GF345_05405 [Candidatus Woesearchaeota archaeon]|nr:hypothetical protein [Candidatus Woesearchaeota archaeon]